MLALQISANKCNSHFFFLLVAADSSDPRGQGLHRMEVTVSSTYVKYGLLQSAVKVV